jgi:plastocyanin
MFARLALLLTLCTACTPGAQVSAAAPAGGIVSGGGSTVIIDVSLTNHPVAQLAQGSGAGYAPLTSTVTVGDFIKFVNSDGFANTATAIPNATSFPNGSPFAASAQNQGGAVLSQSWSSGTLSGVGSGSQAILVDKPGTYLYGCFYHYGAPMRGVIIAQ